MLRKLLNKLDFRKKISGRDIIAFILSLLLAFGIWLIHNLSQNYNIGLDIYVLAKSNIESRAEYAAEPVLYRANVRARGFELIYLSLFSKKDHPRLLEIAPEDFTHVSGEKYSISYDRLGAILQNNLSINLMSAKSAGDSLIFLFPYREAKKVAVIPIYSLSFKPQYMALAPLKIQPDSILIYGSTSSLKGLDKLYTEPLSLDDLSSDISGEVQIAAIKSIRFSQKAVKYSLSVRRYVEVQKTVKVRVINLPANMDLSIYPSETKVNFRLAFPIRDNDLSKISFYIDYKDYLKSLTGQCILHHSPLPDDVYSCNSETSVFDCVEKVNGRK